MSGCLTLLLIFSPVWLPLVAILVWATAAVFLMNKTVELRRGSVMGEWLLEEPLKSFPSDLVPGQTRFYRWFGENSESNIVVVTVPAWRPEYRMKCLEWLLSKGIETPSPGSARHVDLYQGEGWEGTWSIEEQENGTTEMRISLKL